MIAQEAYWSMGFGVFLFIDLVVLKVKGSTPIVVNVLGSICSIVLMCVMGYAYFVSIGTPAWTSVATIPLFLVGDLAMGLAFWALFFKEASKDRVYVALTFVIEALLLVTLCALAVHFSGVGYSPIPFIVAAVIAPIGASLVVYLDSRKTESKYVVFAFVLAVIGVAVARYAFYAASIL